MVLMNLPLEKDVFRIVLQRQELDFSLGDEEKQKAEPSSRPGCFESRDEVLVMMSFSILHSLKLT